MYICKIKLGNNLYKKVNEHPTTSATSIEEHIEDAAKSSIALSASMILIGLLLGFGWAWLRFFRRGKSPRGGMAGSSGQVSNTFLIYIYILCLVLFTGSYPSLGSYVRFFILYTRCYEERCWAV